MLLEMYYHALLVLFLSASTLLHICGASRNARFGFRRLEERVSLDERNVLGLERRQAVTVTPSVVIVTLASAAVVTTEVDVVTVAPISSQSVVVVVQTQTSTSSASPTSTSTTQSSTITSAPGFSCDTGYSPCATEYNGGCCRNGYTCAVDSCIPPATATGEQRTCATGSYLCPASVNYGCCPGGYNCGISQCLAASQMTYTSRTTIVTTDTAGYTVTSTVSSIIAASALGKATESNLGAKQSTRTTITSLTPTASHTNSQLPLSGVVIGGIVAACVIGILVFALVGWCTYRRVGRRANDDPVGVATTNVYHPSINPISRTPGSDSSTRYHTTSPEHAYHRKQPINYHPAVPQPPPGVVEMAESPPFPQNGYAGRWGAGAQQNIGELPGDDGQNVHEVEGTIPARNTKRWSRQFLKRGSGSYQG